MKNRVGKFVFRCVLVMSFMAYADNVYSQMGAIAAIDEPDAAAEARGSSARAGGGRESSSKSGASSGGQPRKASSSAKKLKTSTSSKSKPSSPPTTFNGPVLGDKYTFLNFEVVSVEKPYYTREAKASGAKGLVQVEVLISTDGSVISAKARTGNKALWAEAERAAMASKFNRPQADGRSARAAGFLVYRFGPAE